MKKVTVYTTKTWPHCPPAKEYLANKGIHFVEKDIRDDQDAKKELLKLGSRSVPTIVIDDKVIVGFDEDKINEALEL